MYPTYSTLQPQKSYSSRLETISEKVSFSEKSDHEDQSTHPEKIPDWRNYVTALNQQPILTALANLPVTTKTNMIEVLEQLISIFGRGNPASKIISHIRRLIKISRQAPAFDQNEGNEEGTEDDELQVRALGFDFGPVESEVSVIVPEKLEPPKIPRLPKSVSGKNKQTRPSTEVRDSSGKKSSDMQIYTMSV